MKIRQSELKVIIENYLLEQEEAGGYYIYFAARNISGGIDWLPDALKAGHSWVMVKKPGEPITSYSGKAGIIFTATDFASRYFTGRNLAVDEIATELIALSRQGKVSKDELAKAIKQTDWKELKKKKNWDADTFKVAGNPGNYLQPIMPRKGDTQEDVKAAIERIENSFNTYNETVPYDPLPGASSGNNEAKNSNSFAYTLLRHALQSPSAVSKRIGNPGMELPGFDQLVGGMGSHKK